MNKLYLFIFLFTTNLYPLFHNCPNLNLNKEQLNKLQEGRKTYIEDINKIREEKQKLRTEIDKLLVAEKTKENTQNLIATHKRLQNLNRKLAEKRFAKLLKLRKILSPEQLKAWIECRHKRRHNNSFRHRRSRRRFRKQRFNSNF